MSGRAEVMAVGLLDKFEARLEQAVEGTAAKMFQGAVEPVEVAAALQREATAKRAVLGIDRVVAPNRYEVALSESDFERLEPYADTLTSELATSVAEYLSGQSWSTYGDVVVELREQEDLTTGMFRVSSRAVPSSDGSAARVPRAPGPAAQAAAPAAPIAGGGPRLVIEQTGSQVPVPVGTTVLGRGTAAEIDLIDGSVSRRHAEVRFDGEDATVTDLGSTNGTMVNGESVGRGERVLLSDGDIVRVGSVTVVYRRESR